MRGKVFLAAGHWPERPGAGFEGFYEHDEACRWIALMMHLDPDGKVLHQVPSGPLKNKAAFINTRATVDDIAVEIHFNSAVDQKGQRVGKGCVTLHHPDSTAGSHLAHAVQDVLIRFFPPDRGVVKGWYRGDPTKGPYYFLDRTICPAVIVEPEFVHHRELIQSSRAECAPALARALAAYVGQEL